MAMLEMNDWFQQLNDLLPKGELVESFSVFPLPYEGFLEIFVQTKSKKRYRALANKITTISPLCEMDEILQPKGAK